MESGRKLGFALNKYIYSVRDAYLDAILLTFCEYEKIGIAMKKWSSYLTRHTHTHIYSL